MPSSPKTQTYESSLQNIDESIALLQRKREDILKLLQASSLSDILVYDAAWLADYRATGLDWAHLLGHKSTLQEWRGAVALEGVSGTGEWARTGQRAVSLKFYEELPERRQLYGTLIEELMPFVRPWPEGYPEYLTGCRFVSAKCAGRDNVLIGKSSKNEWCLYHRHEVEVFPDLQSMVQEAFRRTKKSYFCTD